MFRKFTSLMLAICCVFAMSACSNVEVAETNTESVNNIVETTKPVVSETKPAVDVHKPVEESKPATEESKPATEEAKPVEEAEKPATEESKPATEGEKLATEESKPVEEKPATEESKPATESEKPVAEESKPVEEKPTTEESKPAADEKPVEEEKPAEEKPAEESKPAEEKPAEDPGLPKAEDMTWTSVGEREMFVTSVAAVRTGPNIGYTKLDSKAVGEKVIQLEEGSANWSRVQWNDQVAYMYTPYLSDKEPPKPVDTSAYPIVYEDDTSKITIYREWYGNAWVYGAHLEFTDYERFYTVCGNDTYGGFETTLSAAKRHNAIFAVNGCYSAPYLGYKVCRKGVVYNDGTNWNPGVYSSKTGEFHISWEANRGEKGYAGVNLSKLVKEGKVTDTFCFGPPCLVDGKNLCNANDTGRAQRTFMGTNGNKGDLWICVSDGRYNDGVSAGLTGYQCMQYLKEKGCVKGIPLDGGGSSTMVFQGQVLNAARGNLRAVVDHVIFE